MNPNSTYVWLRTIVALVVIAALALLLQAFFDPEWALGLVCVGIIAILTHHLSSISGLLRWLRDPAKSVPDGRGVWEEVFSGLYRLVRANQRQQEALSAEVARFRMAGTAMPDGVVILDAENHIDWCNPMAERFFDIDTAKDAGQSIMNLVRAPEFALYLERGNFAEPLLLRLMRGEGLVLSMRIIPYGKDQKLLLSRDVTQTEKVEVMRRDFVANVSHELKTPVAAMGVLAEALLASADDSDTVRRFAEKVLVEANRLGDMVAELIELSRLQGAERLPNVTEVDVDSVVSEAISRHKVAADNADIEVRTDAPSGLRVLGDETLLVTALANLVSNAIAYSPRGSLVSISRRSCGDDVEIAVTDRGIGIALEDQERVFERFFRGDKARSRATGGSGLGLAIVKHIAANHNGSIGVWSKPGTGSTFTLSIPAYRNGEEMFEQSSGREVRPVRAERPERPERPARPARSEREEELSR